MGRPADLPGPRERAAPPRARRAPGSGNRSLRLDDCLTLREYFATPIYAAPLGGRDAAALNARLLRECLQLRADDRAGRTWSRRNYPGGYTSYASVNRMPQVSPTFAELARRLARHANRFAQALEFDLADRPLELTDCWVNVMPRGVSHGLHLHPASTISGTYYVRTPRGAPGLKFEDPRLDRFMAAPPRRPQASRRPWIVLPARAGELLLFESWLRHEVVANAAATPRVSISFNFSWF